MKNNFEITVELLTKVFPSSKVQHSGSQNEKVTIYYKSGLILKISTKEFFYEIIDGKEPTKEMNDQRKVLKEVFDSSLVTVLFDHWNKKTGEILRKLMIFKV
jgi:hypothetical protein